MPAVDVFKKTNVNRRWLNEVYCFVLLCMLLVPRKGCRYISWFLWVGLDQSSTENILFRSHQTAMQ